MTALYWCPVLDTYATDITPRAFQDTGMCSACGESMEDDHRLVSA